MKSKAQITIYLIIGLLVVIVLGSLFLVKQTSQEAQLSQSQYVFEMGPKQSSLESLISECVKQNVIQGELLYGLRRDWSPAKIESYMKQNLPTCIDSFAKTQKYKTNYGELKVIVSIDHEALIVKVDYPMEFSKKDTLLRFEGQEFRFPRTVMETIDPSTTTRVVSADGTMILEIPPGTVATLNGEVVDKVGLKQLDREFNGLSNSVVAGNLAFNGIPHGVEFSQPVKIIKYFKDDDVGFLHQGDDINVGYYDDVLDVWVGIPTIVDIEKRKLTAEISHFTPFATVTECGEGTGGTITLSDIIYPHVVPCEGWTMENTEWMPAPISGGPNYPPEGFECTETWPVEPGVKIYLAVDSLDEVYGGLYREIDTPSISQEMSGNLEIDEEYVGTYWRDCSKTFTYNKPTTTPPNLGNFNEIMDSCKKVCPKDSAQYCVDNGNDEITCQAVYHGFKKNDGLVANDLNKPNAVKNVEILFENSGDSCIYDPDGDTSKKTFSTVECTTSAMGESCKIESDNDGTAIIITPVCEADNCMIPKGELKSSAESPTLDFNLYAVNRAESTEEVCIYAGATIELAGVGSIEMEYNCENGDGPTYIGGECYVCADGKYTVATDPNDCFKKEENSVCAIEGCFVSTDNNKCLHCVNGKFELYSGNDCPCLDESSTPTGGVIKVVGNVISTVTGKVGGVNPTDKGLCLDGFDPKNPTKPIGGGGGGETTCTIPEDCPEGQLCNPETKKCSADELGGGERPEECASVSAEQCPEFDLDEYKGTTITTDKTLDTRDRGFCDTFGDLSSGTKLLIMDSGMNNGLCWILTESQTVVDGYKPDLYVRYNDIKHLLGEENISCESDDDCSEGFYCSPETNECEEKPDEIIITPIVGYYDFEFTDEISFEPPSLGYYTEENTIVTSNDYTWFIKLNYTNETNLSDVIENNEEILGYWLVDNDCSEDINLEKLYDEYHNETTIPLITKMTKECAEQKLVEDTNFTDIIFFDYDGNDDLLEIETNVKLIPMINVTGMSAYEINETSYNILEKDYLGIVYYPYNEVIVDEYSYINSYGESFCEAKEKFFDEECEYSPELPEEIKIAFIANQGYNQNAYDVLALLTAQEPDLIVINGNLGYDSYDEWSTMISSFDIPFIASIGVEDKVDWEYYSQDIEYNFDDELVCEGKTGDQMTCTFKGISFVVSGVGTTFETQGHLNYINDSLKESTSEWKFCIWNKANKDLRISSKEDNDDLILDYYDVCRKKGAIIITGYDQVYARTKMLSSFEPITPIEGYNIEPEKTIVFMSGLGGYANETYNCSNHDSDTWWSTIFTQNYFLDKNQEIVKSCDEPINNVFSYGALFITINPNGEEHKAHSEFITLDETIVDSIDINNIN